MCPLLSAEGIVGAALFDDSVLVGDGVEGVTAVEPVVRA